MLTLAKLELRPKALLGLTGLTPDQFALILDTFIPLWQASEQKRLSRPNRQRAIGAGNSFKLEPPERVLLTVIYLRQYLTQDFLGLLVFDLHKSNVGRCISATLPLLEQSLPGPIRARTLKPADQEDTIPPSSYKPNRRRKIGTLKEFLEQFPELEEVIIDSSEQPRGQPKPAKKVDGKRPPGRPVDKRRYYSAKAGQHTLKTQMAVSPQGLIVHQSATAPGRMHDSRLLRRSRLGTALGVGTRVIGDKGYVGMDKVYPEYEVITPKMKPKGGQLSEEERELNRLVAKARIEVENAICRVKKYRACGDFYRGPVAQHGVMWGVVSGLVNLRLLDRLAQEAA